MNQILSIIIPSYNEGNNIKILIEKVNEINISKEIIFVNDGSTDNTQIILENLEQSNLKVLNHYIRKGKGQAIRTGLKHITGDIVIIQDADLEYNPKDYYTLLNKFNEGYKVVYGSRVLNKNNNFSYLSFLIGGKFLTFSTNLLYNQSITDEPTCYKMFDAKLLKSIQLECKGFEFCPEVTAKVSRLGYKIQEVPIDYFPRKIKEGKKIKWKDGFIAILILFKYRFISKESITT